MENTNRKKKMRFYFHKVAFSTQIYYIKSCSFKRTTDCVNVLK